jgi:ribosomal protein S18 acetylase RimI-like enzyme
MIMKNATPLLNPRPKTEISHIGLFYPHLGFDLPIADRSHHRSDVVLTNPTSGVAVTLRLNPPEQERVALISKLVDYNQSKAGPRHFSQFGIFSRGPSQELIGGLLGYISWKWFSIEAFWVAESFHRVGLGARLLRQAEEFALTHDCRFAHVETYSFQARGFYEKHGYGLFGKLENYPLGHNCYYLHKTLRAGSAEFFANDI